MTLEVRDDVMRGAGGVEVKQETRGEHLDTHEIVLVIELGEVGDERVEDG